jgi:hypothetical protein
MTPEPERGLRTKGVGARFFGAGEYGLPVAIQNFSGD